MSSPIPLFVVGVPRSGTTLLASMLSAHPAIHAGPETHFFEDLDRRRPPSPSRSAGWIESAVQWLMKIEHVGKPVHCHAGLSEDDLRRYLREQVPSYRAMLEAITVPQMRRAGKSRWLEKTPNHIAHMPTLRRVFPEAKVIRIVRDPRDTIQSLLNVPWGPKSLSAAVSMFADNHSPGERFCSRDPRTLTVRYEDLVTQQEATLDRIGSFVGEKFDAKGDRSKSALEVNRTAEPWKEKVSQAIDPSRAGSWRRDMPEPDQRFIEALLGDVMDRYGYPRQFYARGQRLRVMPLRDLDSCPALVEEVRQGTLGERAFEMILLAGEPDPQRLLDRPSGSRLAMFAEMTGRILIWPITGRQVVWWDEPTARSPGKLAKWMGHMLAPYRARRSA